jgi:pyruvate, orthophosphate dikinase
MAILVMQIARIGNGSTTLYSPEIVGAKAATLARVAALGIPVPPAFVLPVEFCHSIVNDGPDANRQLTEALAEGVRYLEDSTGRRLGDRRRPLLLSVRSGAAQSMPGMLDTVLDVGCTLAAVHGLVRMTGNPRFAWDCRRRFLESYGRVVLGIEATSFARPLAQLVSAEGVESERALDGEAVERLTGRHCQMIEDEYCAVPDDAVDQLNAATGAVYRSWTGERARTYRRLERLEHLRGTAVTIQTMVFGNRGLSSGAGVAFSRDPSTGAAQPVIEVLFDSQGEDVVSGIRNPEGEEAIARSSAAVAAQFRETLAQLERELGEVQDVEFTIEDGRLWILQTRPAKPTARAALRFAIDFVKEGLITPSQGFRRLDGLDFDAIECRRLIDVHEPAARGTGASAGIAVGRAAFDSESAQRLASAGDPVILLRPETSTADVAGFAAASGIVTAAGGRTAHAALVARQMGKPCIVGCTALKVDAARRRAWLADHVLDEGDWLSIDGENGAVHLGRCAVVVERPEAELAEIERWRAASDATK